LVHLSLLKERLLKALKAAIENRAIIAKMGLFVNPIRKSGNIFLSSKTKGEADFVYQNFRTERICFRLLTGSRTTPKPP
jgi:hypothetical protein